MDRSEFVVVVPEAEPQEAARLYEAWLLGRPGLKAKLRGEDVRIDLIRGVGGKCLRRYLVRLDTLEAWNA